MKTPIIGLNERASLDRPAWSFSAGFDAFNFQQMQGRTHIDKDKVRRDGLHDFEFYKRRSMKWFRGILHVGPNLLPIPKEI